MEILLDEGITAWAAAANGLEERDILSVWNTDWMLETIEMN